MGPNGLGACSSDREGAATEAWAFREPMII